MPANKYSDSLLMDALRGSLSNAESFGRGFGVAPVGLLGDVNALAREYITPRLPANLQGLLQSMPSAPTTESILSAIPRMTAPRMESSGMEQIGAAANPRGPINLGRAMASLPSDVARAGQEFLQTTAKPMYAVNLPKSISGRIGNITPESKTEVKNLAETFAEEINKLGFSAKVEHSGSKAGASSYINVTDPLTGRFLSKPIRISDHSKGAKESQGVIDILNPQDDFKKITDALGEMRGMGETLVFKQNKYANELIASGVKPKTAYQRAKTEITEIQPSFQYPQEQALKLAQERAALPVEQGGLGLLAENTPEMRAQAMNAIDYLHGTERMDRLLAGKNFDPRKATSGPMPFGTNTPEMASNYAMNKADTSLALNDVGNLADYFQVMPKSMGERGTSPINVENIWYRLSPEKKSEILDKASRIGYEIPEEAGGGFVLHSTSEGMPYSKSHWDYVLNRESRGNPLTALRKTFAESGMLDAYAPSELADIYKLVGFPYEITQTNAPWTSAKGVFTGKALISNPINTSDTATLQETVIPFLKEQFKNDRTRVKTGGVDQWDKNTRFTPKQWVNQLEEDLSKGENSFVWTSIPDKVTKQLEQLGFNGILDTGGKMGGEAHQVVIPFRPEQLRSRFAAFDPFRKDVATATAMGVALPDLLAAEYNQQPQSAGLLYPLP